MDDLCDESVRGPDFSASINSGYIQQHVETSHTMDAFKQPGDDRSSGDQETTSHLVREIHESVVSHKQGTCVHPQGAPPVLNAAPLASHPVPVAPIACNPQGWGVRVENRDLERVRKPATLAGHDGFQLTLTQEVSSGGKEMGADHSEPPQVQVQLQQEVFISELQSRSQNQAPVTTRFEETSIEHDGFQPTTNGDVFGVMKLMGADRSETPKAGDIYTTMSKPDRETGSKPDVLINTRDDTVSKVCKSAPVAATTTADQKLPSSSADNAPASQSASPAEPCGPQLFTPSTPCCAEVDATTVELRPVPRRLGATMSAGAIAANARFLQQYFRRKVSAAQAVAKRLKAVYMSPWRRGGLRAIGPVRANVAMPRCQSRGFKHATDADFAEQKVLAEKVMDWYRPYVDILTRLNKVKPGIVHAFCGGGGSSEGGARAGLSGHNIDKNVQPDVVNRFGEATFTQADAVDKGELERAAVNCNAIGIMASPPCKPYSTVTREGQNVSEPALIGQTRSVLKEIGKPYAIENVLGAASEMDPHATVLRGFMFGDHVDRGRKFETSFQMHVDQDLLKGGQNLRAKSCLGEKRRWLRLDPYGRPCRRPCCKGNIFAVQGSAPTRSTLSENSAAMGIDEGSMTWESLAQAIPPSMAQYVALQMAMHAANERCGVPMISYDDMLVDPGAARRTMRLWLRGAGENAAAAGVQLVDRAMFEPNRKTGSKPDVLFNTRDDTVSKVSKLAPVAAATTTDRTLPSSSAANESLASSAAWAKQKAAQSKWWAPDSARRGSTLGAAASVKPLPPKRIERIDKLASWEASDWSLPEAEWREVYYSRFGGFDQMAIGADAPWWLGAFTMNPTVDIDQPSLEALSGKNTYFHMPLTKLELWKPVFAAIATSLAWGTRVSVVIPGKGADESALTDLGFKVVRRCNPGSEAWAGTDGLRRVWVTQDIVVMSVGRRDSCMGDVYLNHADVLEHMDPIDGGAPGEPPIRKAQRSWEPIPHDPERWRGKGLPPAVERTMTEGVRLNEADMIGFSEIPQYNWPDYEAWCRACAEADRMVTVGGMEYVPLDEIDEVMATGSVHPWTIVQQGPDKWRACQDYSGGTNLHADSRPFRLPKVTDVRHVCKESSQFAKYDIRDGFWHVPIHEGSRNKLLMRHPASGRILRCTRLPFGFKNSPVEFCEMTEALAQKMRERAGSGVHFFVFVDDFLVVGDTEELTRYGCSVLEDVLTEFGIQWAPHKRRGPARVIEFLGQLISNSPNAPRCIALTEKRQQKLKIMLESWWSKRRGDHDRVEVNPRELAVLLGHLVFASQCVPNGRTFMQSMLSSFKGLVVDWRRGSVRHLGGPWSKMWVNASFFEDVEWWTSHLERANCVPLIKRAQVGEPVALVGTDASDYAAGGLSYVDGQREEVKLVFTEAERRRPINWRELLGILRTIQVWGPRHIGHRVLVESDNMAAVATASQLKSKAEDMQELVRRILEEVKKNNLQLRVTHTPGKKLNRPDEISRPGDPPVEPRYRLSAPFFKVLEQRFGNFTSLLGAERRFPRCPNVLNGRMPGSKPVSLDTNTVLINTKDDRTTKPRLFLHPDHATAGSALRIIGERMALHGTGGISGLIVLPWDEKAMWWGLTKHLSIIARLDTTAPLEANVLGSWVRVGRSRPSLVAAFPRSAGGRIKPLQFESYLPSSGPDGASLEGYVHIVGADRFILPLIPNEFVWTPASQDGSNYGHLYRVEEAYLPDVDAAEEELGPMLAWLWRDANPRRIKAVAPLVPFMIDKVGSFRKPEAQGEARLPFKVEADELYVVSHLVSQHEVPSKRGPPSIEYKFDIEGARLELSAWKLGHDPNAELEGVDAAAAALISAAPEVDTTPDLEEQEVPLRPALPPVVLVRGDPQPPAVQLERAQSGEGKRHLMKTSAVRCLDCNKTFPAASYAMTCRDGFVCIPIPGTESCFDRMQRGKAVRSKTTGSLIKKAQLDSKYGDERLAKARLCVDGKCGVTGKLTPCRDDCGRSIHMLQCAQMSGGFAALGALRCHHCRLQEMKVELPVSAMQMESATCQMIQDMSTGAEGTAANFEQFVRLQLDFVMQMCNGKKTGMALPCDSRASFHGFLLWMVISSGRARSFDTVVRAAGAYMTRNNKTDWTKDKGMKAIIKDLRSAHGIEAEPMTHGTRGMLVHILYYQLPRLQNIKIRLRTQFLLVAEAVGGLRVGEATGEVHGLRAINTCVLQEITTGKRSVELRVEHSKTGFPRYINMVERTERSKIECVKHLEALWADSKVSLVRFEDSGFMVTQPDYYVLRVNLVSWTPAKQASLELVLRAFSRRHREVGELEKNILQYVKRKTKPGSKLGEKFKYVNVFGSTQQDALLSQMQQAFYSQGFAKEAAAIVPGPLIRATAGSVYNHMPFEPGSTYTLLHAVMEKAHKALNDIGKSLSDSELDLQGLTEPKWGNHSWRRFCDKIARETMKETGATEIDIDLYLGWNELIHHKEMQLHYEGLQRGSRVRRSRLLMMI